MNRHCGHGDAKQTKCLQWFAAKTLYCLKVQSRSLPVFFYYLKFFTRSMLSGHSEHISAKSESAPEGCIVLLERTINNYHDEMATKETEPGGPLGSQPRQMDYNTRLGHQHGLQDRAGQKHTRSLHTHTHNAHRQYRSANEEPANHRPSLCQDQ